MQEWCEKHNYRVVGWIHTHPTFEAFLSSIDMHSQVGLQRDDPRCTAVVLDQHRTPRFLRLSEIGMEVVQGCSQHGFHDHEGHTKEELQVDVDVNMLTFGRASYYRIKDMNTGAERMSEELDKVMSEVVHTSSQLVSPGQPSPQMPPTSTGLAALEELAMAAISQLATNAEWLTQLNGGVAKIHGEYPGLDDVLFQSNWTGTTFQEMTPAKLPQLLANIVRARTRIQEDRKRKRRQAHKQTGRRTHVQGRRVDLKEKVGERLRSTYSPNRKNDIVLRVRCLPTPIKEEPTEPPPLVDLEAASQPPASSNATSSTGGQGNTGGSASASGNSASANVGNINVVVNLPPPPRRRRLKKKQPNPNIVKVKDKPGKLGTIPIYKKCQIIEYYKSLTSSRFKNREALCVQHYAGLLRTGQLRKWLTSYDTQHWAKIPWDQMNTKMKEDMRELPNWLRETLGMKKKGRQDSTTLHPKIEEQFEKMLGIGLYGQAKPHNIRASKLSLKSLEKTMATVVDRFNTKVREEQ